MSAVVRPYRHGSAGCSLWLSGCPQFEGLRTAAIGRFHCGDAASGEGLLARVLADLEREGFQFVVGPMDGDTWHSYRLVVESDGSPPFFLEPADPPSHRLAFEACGFEAIASYESARVEAFRSREVGRYARRLERAGIRVRRFDRAESERELKKIYALSLEAFSGNFLYTPITQEAFADLYRPLLDRLDPDYVLLAETAQGTLRAFVFAIPDLLQGTNPDRLIIKTYASRHAGLGGYLSDLVQAKATQAGYKTIIHALMHSDNPSKRNSEKYGRAFRRYAVLGRKVGR